MSAILEKIAKQADSMQKKIDGLSGNYLTNTWKRQQEQRHRDEQIERFKQRKQVLEYLAEQVGLRELTALESALIVNTFYEDMRVMLVQKQHAEEFPSARNSYTILSQGEVTDKKYNKAGIYNGADMIAAVAEFENLVNVAATPPDPNAAKIRDITFRARLSQKGDIQFTPEKIANQLIALSGINASSKVLEPEAGIGSIADEVKKITSDVDCVERMYEFGELLKLKGHNFIGQDFLDCDPQPVYDAVIMNPPFSDECRHIRHAYDFLKPGGKLTAVCCVRMVDSDQRKYTEHREWLAGQDYWFTDTDEKFEMTGTNTKILVIEKAAA